MNRDTKFFILDGGEQLRFLTSDPPMFEERYSVQRGPREPWMRVVGEPYTSEADAFQEARRLNDKWYAKVKDRVEAYLHKF